YPSPFSSYMLTSSMFCLIGSGTEIIFLQIYFVDPQLALSVEFLFEILYVGAPPIIEKCLLHGHFHSVNYYQYNIVEPKTLIYYVLGSIPSFND
ncbi:hypothetical protein, partial [Staphylococcus aureus]|uniref:hypothetical protein n=1 Tax=Staphylococcus aureus TaxID=1280 RepID=UPI00203C0D03